MRGLLASLLLLAGLATGTPAARSEPAGLAGRWSAETARGRVELLVEPAGRDTTVRLALAGHPLFDARFVPTDRPDVLEAAATGLFAMLGSRGAPANPLEGEELVWARAVGAGLVLTRLAIDQGRPAIERARLEPAGEGVRLVLERLEGERMAAGLEARLGRDRR